MTFVWYTALSRRAKQRPPHTAHPVRCSILAAHTWLRAKEPPWRKRASIIALCGTRRPSTSSRRVLTSPPSVDGQATRAELTMRYAQAGIDMKRQALEQVFPDVMSSAKDQTIIALMAGCLAGCTACRRSVMWSCIAGSRASWAFAVSAQHLSAVHVVTVEEPFVQSSSWHGKGCPYCGVLRLPSLSEIQRRIRREHCCVVRQPERGERRRFLPAP